MDEQATTTRAERERRVADAIHSGVMEGLQVTPETQADAQKYIDGLIDSDELVARARSRYVSTDRYPTVSLVDHVKIGPPPLA